MRFLMKDVLKLIVETDKASRLEVQKAVDGREALNESLTEIKDEIYSKYDQKARTQTENEKASAESETEKEKKRIAARTEQKKQELNALYEREHTAWEKHIADAVVSD